MSREETFEAFVASASTRLLRLSYLLVGDAGAAEDLLQDVLERMYVRWSRIDDPSAYASRALAHAASNRWRSRRRRPEVPLDRHDRAVVNPEPLGTSPLMAALSALPAGQRAVMVLRYFADLSIEQTAATLGCSTGTVKSQSARALPRLRELLAAQEEMH